MQFNAVIDKIMPDVESGSKEPFIIYRDKIAGWQCDYTNNQYGEPFDWVDAVKESDPCALTYTGKDFAKGSFSYVYDAALRGRLWAEFKHYKDVGMYGQDLAHSWLARMKKSNVLAYIEFLDDHIGYFSQKVTDYLTEAEHPFAEFCKICPGNIFPDREGQVYNNYYVTKAIECVEENVNRYLQSIEKTAVMTLGNCIKDSHYADFTGKPLVVKADALMPEYRNPLSQLVFCTHGNGARPKGKGTSIFCKELASNKTVVYYRDEIEGVADIRKIPSWAKLKLSEMEDKQKAKGKIKLTSKPSIASNLEKSKAIVAATDRQQRAISKTNKRTDREVK